RTVGVGLLQGWKPQRHVLAPHRLRASDRRVLRREAGAARLGRDAAADVRVVPDHRRHPDVLAEVSVDSSSGRGASRFPALVLLAVAAATWHPQSTGTTSELRGLTAVDGTHAWASGSGGTIVHTRDGRTWEKLTPPAGGEALDFRDIEALDGGKTVVLMSAGPGDASKIYRSTDGGASWKLAHTNPEKDGFYDAVAFWDDREGLVLGDPVNGKFRIRATRDGGATWTMEHGMVMPPALENEGAFAASGTCLFALKG